MYDLASEKGIIRDHVSFIMYHGCFDYLHASESEVLVAMKQT